MAESSRADTWLKSIEGILEREDQGFEHLAGKLDAQNSVLQVIAERLASIDEHIQGNANLLWRIEAALVIQRRRLDALEKSMAPLLSSQQDKTKGDNRAGAYPAGRLDEFRPLSRDADHSSMSSRRRSKRSERRQAASTRSRFTWAKASSQTSRGHERPVPPLESPP